MSLFNKKEIEKECESRIDIKDYNSVTECPKCGRPSVACIDGRYWWRRKWDIVKDVLHVNCDCGYFWVERTKDYPNVI